MLIYRKTINIYWKGRLEPFYQHFPDQPMTAMTMTVMTVGVFIFLYSTNKRGEREALFWRKTVEGADDGLNLLVGHCLMAGDGKFLS